MEVGDVEDIGNRYLVSVGDNNNNYSGPFIIGTLFYEKVKKYLSLRLNNVVSNRLFLRYSEGKCTTQFIGVHMIGKVSTYIAEYLHLPSPNRFTGHCLRRTSATLASDNGATMQMIKQLGRWRSDATAQGYIENYRKLYSQ